MKALKYIVWILLIAVLVLYIIPATLLQVPYFQKKIAKIATEYLEERIETDVQIGRVEFQLFNKLILKNIYLEDQSGDTLFTAKRVAVGFDFIPLFKQKFHFSSAQIYTFTLKLNKETPVSPLNIQYIIDAFQSDKEKKETNIDVSIKNLSLGHGNFAYQIKNKDITPEKFNANDVYLSNITAKIKLKEVKNNKLEADIKRLSFAEKAGFQVKHLAFDLAINSEKANINHLRLELPQSKIHLTTISAEYDQILPEDNFIEKVLFNFQIEPSTIRLKDISSIVPVFSYFRDKIEIQGFAYGTFSDLNLKDFTVKEGKDLFISTNTNVQNLNSSDIRSIYINSDIHDSHITSRGIQRIVDNFNPKPNPLPEPVKNLGQVSIEGNAIGYLNNLSAYVNLKTEIGNLRADVNLGKEQMMTVNGKISSSEIDVKKLMGNDDFGSANFQIDLNAAFKNEKDFKGQIDALVNYFEYKSYRYENISLQGELTPNSFKGLLNADNMNGQLTANGLFSFDGKDSEFDFSAKVTDLLPDKLNLTKKYKEPKLSFALNANVKGNNPDNMIGNLALSDFSFSTDKGIYSMDHLSIESSLQEENQKALVINSDVITGKIEGNSAINSLIPALKETLSLHLPSLVTSNKKSNTTKGIDLKLDLSINDTRNLSYIFELPVTLYNKSRISGEYNSLYHKFQLNAYFPRANFFGSLVESFTVDLNNFQNCIELKLDGISQQKKDNKLIVAADFKALNDSIYSAIEWKDNKDLKYRGKLDFATQLIFPDKNKPLSISTHLDSSKLVFNDSIWTISPAKIQFKDNQLSINNFNATHNKQFIKINGDISPNEEDEISIALNQVNLDYIFKSLDKKTLTFGGLATGTVSAKDVYNTRKLSTNLDIIDFSFNDVVFGHLDLLGLWDEENQGVVMKGSVFKDDTTHVNVDGIIYPMKEELSILFDAKNANAAFLRKWLDNVVKDFSGNITGKIRLFGSLNDPTIEGNAWVENASFGIEFLNTKYTFSDWVRCTPDEISLKDVIIQDKYGNKALANGYVRHKLFDDFEFSTQLSYDNFMIFNANYLASPNFYGTGFGTGTASIRGTEDLVFIDVSMHNTEKTHITLNVMEETDIVNYDFINFVNQKKDTISELFFEQPINQPVQAKETEIRLNLNVVINNEATLEMIMDPRSGDKISAVGNGNTRIEYGTKTPVKVFGNYTIERGKYNFSLEQALIRNFEIEDGSSVTFQGDPNAANLNVKAAYTTTANLGDLDQRLLELNVSARNNIPVSCILLLSGPLEQPLIKFDLEFPGATSELERQVKSYIRTEDMMTRQIAYLLVLKRFYTSPEYARSDARFNNDFSYLASALSTQISNILGNISDNFQVGTKFHQAYEGDEASTEVELLMSSTLLNNRLIINGNFGYIDNPYTHQENGNIPLVGDFDIEYKLTKSGDIRLKGFNHYNYRNYYSSTPEMTQGFGILFRKDFNNFNDLFRKKRVLNPITIPEQKADSVVPLSPVTE